MCLCAGRTAMMRTIQGLIKKTNAEKKIFLRINVKLTGFENRDHNPGSAVYRLTRRTLEIDWIVLCFRQNE